MREDSGTCGCQVSEGSETQQTSPAGMSDVSLSSAIMWCSWCSWRKRSLQSFAYIYFFKNNFSNLQYGVIKLFIIRWQCWSAIITFKAWRCIFFSIEIIRSRNQSYLAIVGNFFLTWIFLDFSKAKHIPV